jgi:hypothetical protein
LRVASAYGADIDHKDLLIAGLSLEVDTTTVVADSGIAAAVQTKFGGKINDHAPPDNGMTAVGELTGPGIDTPIPLVTKPGHLFQLPLLYEKGDYVLRNIRLVSADGKTLQTAAPSFANITITQTLTTKLTVHQLTPDELRARGITVDANNYDVLSGRLQPLHLALGDEHCRSPRQHRLQVERVDSADLGRQSEARMLLVQPSGVPRSGEGSRSPECLRAPDDRSIRECTPGSLRRRNEQLRGQYFDLHRQQLRLPRRRQPPARPRFHGHGRHSPIDCRAHCRRCSARRRRRVAGCAEHVR